MEDSVGKMKPKDTGETIYRYIRGPLLSLAWGVILVDYRVVRNSESYTHQRNARRGLKSLTLAAEAARSRGTLAPSTFTRLWRNG